jgi:hypothetical protein
MPSLNPLSAVDSARNFMNLVKEVNLDEIRERAELPPRILVVARNADQASKMGRIVFGSESANLLEFRSADQVGSIETSRYDLIVVSDPGQTALLQGS